MRRGSSTMIFLPFVQGSSSSASGTRVVLPAPGGATSTAALRPASVRASSSSTASIGRGVSKLRGNGGSRATLPLSPCGRGWLREAKTGDGSLSAETVPSSGALRAPPSPTRGEGKKGASTSLQRRAADAFIDEAVGRHVLGTVDVAQIDHDRLRHLLFQSLQVE